MISWHSHRREISGAELVGDVAYAVILRAILCIRLGPCNERSTDQFKLRFDRYFYTSAIARAMISLAPSGAKITMIFEGSIKKRYERDEKNLDPT
jgi:hypothetical protein